MKNVNFRQGKLRKNFELRFKIIKEIRNFFDKLNFLEVETPIRIPINTPESNIYSQNSGKWHLHTSPELCMKRFLAAGYDKIFQVCKCFRKFERGSLHLPEMTLLEWYEIGLNYFGMMDQCESLLKYIATKLSIKYFYYKERQIKLFKKWNRISLEELFNTYSPISLEKSISSDNFEKIMIKYIEPNLCVNSPIFVYNYPLCFSPLAQINDNNHFTAERFELYCGEIELCNGYSELNNSQEQKSRFEQEMNKIGKSHCNTNKLLKKFLLSLDNLPYSAGAAMGVDRLVMLFANASEIDDVVSFVPEELL